MADERNLLKRLQNAIKTEEEDAIEKLSNDLKTLKDGQREFVDVIGDFIQSTNDRMDKLETSIEIVKNKSHNVKHETNKNTLQFEGKVDQANINTGKGKQDIGENE